MTSSILNCSKKEKNDPAALPPQWSRGINRHARSHSRSCPLSNPLVYVLLKIALGLEATGICAGAWFLGMIHKKVAGFQRDEVYVGTAEERAEKAKNKDPTLPKQQVAMAPLTTNGIIGNMTAEEYLANFLGTEHMSSERWANIVSNITTELRGRTPYIHILGVAWSLFEAPIWNMLRLGQFRSADITSSAIAGVVAPMTHRVVCLCGSLHRNPYIDSSE